jgi:hypothetical protein
MPFDSCQDSELTKIHHLLIRVEDFWLEGFQNWPEPVSPMVAARRAVYLYTF